MSPSTWAMACYFGWPQAHEDEAERAVRAGLDLVAAVAGLATPDEASIAARVGIATGRVVVGELIGAGTAQEEAVIGETPKGPIPNRGHGLVIGRVKNENPVTSSATGAKAPRVAAGVALAVADGNGRGRSER